MTMAHPRLLWLTQGNSPKLPSQRLRVLEIMPLLKDAFDQSWHAAPTTLLAVWRLRQRLRAADLVVLQKELVPLAVLKLLRFYCRRLVYDFDDAVHVRLLADGRCRTSRKRARRFAAICRSADLIIAGNAILEGVAQRYHARKTAILPTGVAMPEVVPAGGRNAGPVRLGWIGTNVNLPYVEALEPIFTQLQAEGLCFVLRVMAGQSPRFQRFSAVEFVPWATHAEEEFLASLDIGLMPLANNEHTRGKCAYKALQYMSLGKAVVVSDVGINGDWTAGAGFAAKTEDDFADGLRRLIMDADLRQHMGRKGRERIAVEFSRAVVACRLRELLVGVLAGSA